MSHHGIILVCQENIFYFIADGINQEDIRGRGSLTQKEEKQIILLNLERGVELREMF